MEFNKKQDWLSNKLWQIMMWYYTQKEHIKLSRNNFLVTVIPENDICSEIKNWR